MPDYIVSNLIGFAVPISLVFVSIVFYMFIAKRTQQKSIQERLEFTSREIEIAIKKIESYPQFQGMSLIYRNYDEESFFDNVDFSFDEINSIYAILSVFNKIALAIEDGIYDENYVEITIGREMRIIYKNSLSVIRFMRHESGEDELFLPIELLLSEWSKNKYRFGRRVMRRRQIYE